MGSNHKSLQAILGAPGVRGKRVTALSKDGLTDFVLSMISKKQELKEPFYVLDLGVVVSLMEKWSRALPLVRPFYAVKAVFDTASRLGLPRMHVLNIGGGFTSGPHFDDATSAIKSSLQAYFPNEHGLTIIGEPGRYFAESAFTLVTNIIGKRVRSELRENLRKKIDCVFALEFGILIINMDCCNGVLYNLIKLFSLSISRKQKSYNFFSYWIVHVKSSILLKKSKSPWLS
ncbi:unnamed protein product, partial [Vitis vinifera]